MKKRNVLLTAALVAIAGALAWAFLPVGPDPQVAKVVELQKKLFNEDSPVPREERRKAFGELRQEMEKLTPQQRDQIMRDNPPPFFRRMQENIVAYFDLPQDQRTAALDKQIDEMEKQRKEWAKRRAERNAGGGARPPGAARGFGRNMDPAQQNQRRKQMLDNTSPQQRAMFGEYFRQLQQRRQERGLPPMRGPR
jgi:hypothetical protein